MGNPDKGKGNRAPARAASLQRMLEMERKQKMERLQHNPYAAATGRHSESPTASHPKSGLLARSRESSQPPDDQRRSSTVRNYSLPPASGHSRTPSSSRHTHERSAKHSQPKKMPPLKEVKKGSADRDGLPSVKRATAEFGQSPQAKTVSFLPSDDDQSETSSICHSPTWDDYGKRRKEKEGAAKEARSVKKRLTKEPPPAAMDNRSGMKPRVKDTPLLDRTNSHNNLPSERPPLDPKAQTSRPQPLPLSSPPGSAEPVRAGSKSPAFIGGVRLERERDAALKKLKDTRPPSGERPGSNSSRHNQSGHSPTAEQPRRRETGTSYPPTASKTPFLKQSSSGKSHSRKRSGSFSGVVSKLFGSSKSSQDPQPYLERRESSESVHTVRSLLSLTKGRGRQRSGSNTPQSQSRAQSRDNLSRSASTPIDDARSGINLPPLSWKNSRKKKTTSMVAIPPDSARIGTISTDSSEAGHDNHSFLGRPFSPPVEGPLSPTASLSASMKAKLSPQSNSAKNARSSSPPPKKTLKETIKAGFRSSISAEPKPSHRRARTEETFVIEVETPPILSSDSHPLQSHPVARSLTITSDKPPSSSRGPRRSDEHHAGAAKQAQAPGEIKDSGASTSSSHPDSGSGPPSPVTTPDTSRPQSSKENTTTDAEDLKKLPLLSLHLTNGSAMKNPASAVVGSYSNFSTHANFLQGNVGRPRGAPQEHINQQTTNGSNFIGDIPAQSSFSDDLWSQSKAPLDPDQLSFTSALTNLDVKRSFQDLGSADPGTEPSHHDRDNQYTSQAKKVTLKRIQIDAAKKQNLSDVSSVSTIDTSFLPSPRHQTMPPQTSGRPGQALLPPTKTEHQPSSYSHAQTDNSDPLVSSFATASAYLQEARKTAPSPRLPTAKTFPISGSSSNNNSHPTSSGAGSNSLASRAFTLAQLQGGQPPQAAAAPLVHPPPSGGPAVPSARHSSLDTTGIKPIAKMFVECCHCRFYQDMPSRVYEAMARPEDTVRDKRLGVSGQVTTCVKCPWCAHNMSTQCCAGFAAVVYLREKLHGP